MERHTHTEEVETFRKSSVEGRTEVHFEVGKKKNDFRVQKSVFTIINLYYMESKESASALLICQKCSPSIVIPCLLTPSLPVSLSPMAARRGSSSLTERVRQRLKPCHHKSRPSRQGPTVLTPVRPCPPRGL